MAQVVMAQEHSADEDVLENGCAALRAIAYCADCRAALVDAAAVPAVVAALRDYGGEYVGMVEEVLTNIIIVI